MRHGCLRLALATGALSWTLALVACGGPPSAPAANTASISDKEPVFRFPASSTATKLYVPVLIYKHPAHGSTTRDTFSASRDLESCKSFLKTQAAKPIPQHLAGNQISQMICYEVDRGGGQTKIPVT
jgi:hypothetical protein